MATKKPTAKQLAARKLFAARAKAGTLRKPVGRPSQTTGKKPSPRLKARREKSIPGYFANPVKAYRGKYPQRVNTVYGSGVRGVAIVVLNDGTKHEVRATDVGNRLPKPGDDFDAATRKKNPVVRGTRKTPHEGAEVFRYVVSTAISETAKQTVVAGFVFPKDARAYAHALKRMFPGLWIFVDDSE